MLPVGYQEDALFSVANHSEKKTKLKVDCIEYEVLGANAVSYSFLSNLDNLVV